MTNIIKKIVAPGHGYFSSPNPVYFAIHSTANPGATAANHVSYWSGGGKNYAVHLVSDWKEAYQCVEFDRKCWQVGNGNYTCIGIEICEATNKADFERGMLIARDVILQILERYGWDIDKHVRSHKWFTENYGGSDHVDPIPYLKKWGWSWEKFIDFLKEGEEMVDPKEIAKEVWKYGIQNPRNENWQEASDYLRWAAVNSTDIKVEVMRTDDPTGREQEMKDHDHIKWIAKTVVEQGEKIDKILELLGASEEATDEDAEEEE